MDPILSIVFLILIVKLLLGLVLWLMIGFLLLVVKRVILWLNLVHLFSSAHGGMRYMIHLLCSSWGFPFSRLACSYLWWSWYLNARDLLCIILNIRWFVPGSLWGCLYAGWRDEVESVATYAKARFPYRVCLGCCQQFHYHCGRHNRKASSDQKDDPGWRGVPISSRLTGMDLFASLKNLERNYQCHCYS